MSAVIKREPTVGVREIELDDDDEECSLCEREYPAAALLRVFLDASNCRFICPSCARLVSARWARAMDRDEVACGVEDGGDEA